MLPSPGTPALSAHIVPPIASARRLEIASPSPVPPYLRLVAASAWLNDLNMRPIASAAMPMPVSATAMWSSKSPLSSGAVLLALSTTLPRSVNLTELLSRLSRIWRSRLTSPISVSGSRVDARLDRQALVRGQRTDQRDGGVHALAQAERRRLELHAPGLDLREVEDVVDDRQQRLAARADDRRLLALLGVEVAAQQQAAHADHRIHRRADLVAHGGEERALRGVRRVGGARASRAIVQAGVVERDRARAARSAAGARPPRPRTAAPRSCRVPRRARRRCRCPRAAARPPSRGCGRAGTSATRPSQLS